MTAFDFSLVKNTSFAFDATADSLNMGAIDAATLTVSTDASSNLVLTSGTDSVTLTGASAEQLTTTNITFGTATDRAILAVGDNATGTSFDASGNTLDLTNASLTNTTATQADANHLVYGFGGADTITVGNGDNSIFGGSGGVDTVDGNDVITAGTGGNTIFGNAGNDQINIGATQSGKVTTIYGGLGNDSVDLTADAPGDLMIFGNTGEDNIDLNTNDNTGDSTIYGGNGTADTADGADTIVYGTGNVMLFSNAGNDTVTANATQANHAASVFLGLGDDSFTGAAAGAVSATLSLYGNTGADTLNNTAFTGDATIFGGNGQADSTDGADTISTGLGSSIVYANAGNDTITIAGNIVAGESVIVHTGSGNDTVNASDGTTTDIGVLLYSNDGDDTFNLNNNVGAEYDFTLGDFAAGDIVNVTLDGAAAATQLTVSGGGSSLTLDDANGGSYSFQGYSGDLNATNFVISDGTALITNFSGTAATLTGTAGTDHLVSGSSGDTIVGAGGADKLIGGEGDDTFQFTNTVGDALDSLAVTVSGDTGTDTLEITGGAATMTDADFDTDGTPFITSVEILKLADAASNALTSLGADFELAGFNQVDAGALTGSNQLTASFADAFDMDITVTGGAGADSLDFQDTDGNFNISFDGAAGADSIIVDDIDLDSSDTITGGTGTDKFILADAAGGSTITDAAFTNFTGVEELETEASAGAVTLTLGAQAQEGGIVTVDGALTGQVLTVDASAYTTGISLIGGGSADILTGGTADDTIDGGAGVDASITGGAGSDLFTQNAGTTEAAAGNDVIIDFIAGASGDSIGLDRTEVGKTAATTLASTDVRMEVATGSMGTELGGVSTGDAADRVVVLNNTTYASEALAEDAANVVADAGTDVTAGEEIYIIWSDGTDSFIANDNDNWDTDGNGANIETLFTLSGYDLADLNTLILSNFDFV